MSLERDDTLLVGEISAGCAAMQLIDSGVYVIAVRGIHKHMGNDNSTWEGPIKLTLQHRAVLPPRLHNMISASSLSLLPAYAFTTPETLQGRQGNDHKVYKNDFQVQDHAFP